MSTGETSTRRPYRSQLREQQATATRRAVLDAARQLFTARGWAATGVRDVAAAAGVSTETVYAHFSSKPGLLRAVADVVVAGDDEPVPIAGRPEFLALGVGGREDRIRAAARLITAIQVRTAAMAMLLREAAPADADIAAMLTATRERQRSDVARGLELIVGRAPTPSERDEVWALLSPEVYLLLVEGSGWVPEQYEEWVVGLLERVVAHS